MTTEHERALSNAHRVNDILREECTELELQRVAARLALAERDAEIARLSELIEFAARADAEISRLKPAPGYLSWKLNPFPERRPATQATEIAEKLIRAYLLDVGAGMDDFTQHEVEFSEKIAAVIGAAAQAPASIKAAEARGRAAAAEAVKNALIPTPDTLTNDWAFGWDHARDKALLALRDLAEAKPKNEKPNVANVSSASALEIAERFRLFFQRPYPMSEEGVERAVQALAQEIEAAIRHNEARPGTSALEATRDLFQSLEGWRPTDDWTGVPPRKKLLFDRTLHAIEAAEARGRERL
jgi:hypothetical protein